ncbi:MAG: methyltransferase domain-containing protein [Candidatus Thorarchaeota archaeon]
MTLRKLNLGCGKDIKKGYINLDQSKQEGVDVVHDLNKYPWPFKDNHFDEIYARDCIEHLNDLFKAMSEIKRICKKDALVRIIVPYWHSSGAFYPDHKYVFNVDSMKFFIEPNRGYDNYYGFKLEKVKLIPSRIGWLIPSLPMPKFLFPNVINLRHLFSYLLGEIIVKIYFELRVFK